MNGTLTSVMMAVLLAPWSVSAADWNQWRGPTRDGQVTGGPDWPARLDSGALVQRWRTPELGPSYSGPLVTADRVFTTASRDKEAEVVVAFDRASGRELWRHEWEGYMKVPFFARSNGDWIRSTPALADGRLFVGGMRDVLVCLDAATGRELWRVDFPGQLETPLPDFGFVSSPLVAGGAVYVQAGAGTVKVDAATGKVLWRSLVDGGGMWGSAFSSPLLASLGGTEQLLVQGRDKLAAVLPADGTVLWEQPIKAFRGMNILTPVVAGDRVFTSAYGGVTQGWNVERADGKWAVREAWQLKLEGYMSTPVVIDGHAYHHTRAQRLVCVELATGRKCWETEQKFGKYLSLVAQGRRILALDQRGTLLLFEADPTQYRPSGEFSVTKDEAWAHLAVSGSDVIVREQQALSVWSWAAAKP